MKNLWRVLWLCIWIGAALYLALTLWLAFIGLAYPFQLDYGEGIVLWFAREIAHGHPIYKEMLGYPYASSNYPPLALILSAALMPIFGEGYVGGRLLNFAAALVVAALIFRIVRAETRDPRSAALAALFFIGAPYVYHWIPLFRVDLIGLAFAVAGVYWVWLWETSRQQAEESRQQAAGSRQKRTDSGKQEAESGKRGYQTAYLLLEPACLLLATACLLLATACFLLSLYTKHTLIAAPAAAFFAIFRRDKRAALAFALALGAMGGAIYVALDAATNGAFTFGLITSNATVFLPDQLAALVRTFAITFAPLLILAGWSFIARVRGGRFGVLEAYALTAFAGLAMAGRVGAWENYFFEAIFVVCVLAFSNSKFLILNSEFKIRFDENLEFRVLALVLLLQLALFWRDPRVAANLIAEDLPANRQLSALLAHTDGTIISEDMGALVTSRQPVAYYTFQYSSLARSGKWDQSWELNGLSAGAFPLVVLERGTRQNVERYRRFTREFVSALDRYYARAEVIGKYEVYRPAPLAHLQFANFGDAIALVGWSAQPDVPSTFGGETLRPGTLELAVVWQAQRALTRRYTAFAHLENAAGGKVAQDDREPHGGLYPTVRWAASEMVREAYTLNVPGDLPRGRYVLKVGWYDSESGERLSVAGSADDTVAVGEWMYNGK